MSLNLDDPYDDFFSKHGGHDAGEVLGVKAGFEHRDFDWKVRQGVEKKRKSVRTHAVDDWYISPYMTCKECNSTMFIDEGPLRLRILQNVGAVSPFVEGLPKCSGCGCTHAYTIGVNDFSDLIEVNRINLYRERSDRASASLMVQSRFRGHRKRRLFLSRVAERKRIELALKNAALRVQTRYRGRLGWRRHRTIKFLKRLEGAHAMVLLEAQHNDFGSGKRVFWYRRAQEREQLFKDYAVLVKRTGNRPPMIVVERNIVELHRRVHLIESRYAQNIQARYRGMLGRKAAWMYRQNLARLLEHELHAAIRIQRTLRGWLGWTRAFKRALHRRGVAVKEEYLKEAKEGWLRDKFNARSNLLLETYRRERAEEIQVRNADRVPYGTADGLNMKAFQESAYGRPETLPLMTEFAKMEKITGKEIVAKKKAKRDRSRLIMDRYEENPMMKRYWKTEMSDEQARDLRWIIDLSKKRINMSKRLYGNSKFSRKISKAMAASAEKKMQKLGNRVAKQRIEAALQFKLKGGKKK
eukprot:g377.t1